MSKQLRPIRSLLLGAPGAGKGTMTSRMLKDFPTIPSVSSGDLLRDNIQKGTDLGHKVEGIIKRGGLVDDEIMIQLISRHLASNNWLNSTSSWLLDGFPRSLPQAQKLDETLARSKADLNLVVQLDVPEQVILDRIENRWVHLPSGRIYNLTFNPPKVPGKDDVTGEPLSKREDDNVDTFKKRLAKYKEITVPLLEYYQKKGVLHVIQGDTSDIIYPKLKSLLVSQRG